MCIIQDKFSSLWPSLTERTMSRQEIYVMHVQALTSANITQEWFGRNGCLKGGNQASDWVNYVAGGVWNDSIRQGILGSEVCRRFWVSHSVLRRLQEWPWPAGNAKEWAQPGRLRVTVNCGPRLVGTVFIITWHLQSCTYPNVDIPQPTTRVLPECSIRFLLRCLRLLLLFSALVQFLVVDLVQNTN